MKEPNQLIDDRVIPLSPVLALYLGYLPGIDDRDARDKSKPRPRRRETGITSSQRGINRALVLTQVNHRLKDSAPTDRRLFAREDTRWYARTYREWHTWDFPFMAYATMVKTFQDLVDAGYLLARLETEFVKPDDLIVDRRALLRVMGVYNGKCFSIDSEKLAQDMAGDDRVRAYYAVMFPNRTTPEDDPATSDQPDQTPLNSGLTSDQDDQTVRSGRSDPPDQVDQRVRSGRSGGSDHPDQRSSESESAGDQSLAESSAAEAAPPPTDSRTGAEENKKANPEPPTPAPAESIQPLYLQLSDQQKTAYMRLAAYHVDEREAIEFVQTCALDQITAWCDYVKRANAPDSKLTNVRNPGGYIRDMLRKGPRNYPSPAPKPEPDDGTRFLTGKYAGEINH